MDELLKLLVGLEREVNEKGWDQPPLLLGLQRVGGRIESQVLPVKIRDPADQFLLGAARQFKQLGLARMLTANTGRRSSIFGLVFVYEAWRAPSQESLTALLPHQTHADLPGATEIRNVAVATVEGDAFMVTRSRGVKDLEAIHWFNQGGPVFLALAIMITEIAGLAGASPETLAELTHMQTTLERENKEENAPS